MVFLYGNGNYLTYIAALNHHGISINSNISACNGLLLPGGGDIHGSLDECEHSVIKYFVERSLPVLGICRGLQSLNVWFGGTLFDDVSGHQNPSGDIFHAVHGFDMTLVNSNHHQAIDHIGDELTARQWAFDGIIEAVTHNKLPILGVQWHPERYEEGDWVFRWFKEQMSHEGRT